MRRATLAALGLLLAAGTVAFGHAPRLWPARAPTPPLRVIRTHLVDHALDPSVVVLEPGPVRFEITNDCAAAQRFVVHGPATFAHTAELPSGATATLDVTLAEAGAYDLEAVSPSGGVMARGSLEVRQ